MQFIKRPGFVIGDIPRCFLRGDFLESAKKANDRGPIYLPAYLLSHVNTNYHRVVSYIEVLCQIHCYSLSFFIINVY